MEVVEWMEGEPVTVEAYMCRRGLMATFASKRCQQPQQ
jgi:hypothetical protein